MNDRPGDGGEPGRDARSLHGRLALRLAPASESRTRIVNACRTPPFQLQRALYIDPKLPDLAEVRILNGSAGLFAGDRLELRVEAAKGARASLRTPAMSRVFGMPEDGTAHTYLGLLVEAGAYLEYLPEPLLLCRGARLQHAQLVEVAAGGCLAAGETLALGREASGERHAYRGLLQRAELKYAGRLLLAEALTLDTVASPGVMTAGMLGAAAAVGSLHLLCSCGHDDGLLGELGELLDLVRPVRAAVTSPDGAYVGSGCALQIVRAMGPAASAVQAVLHAAVLLFRRRHSRDGPAARGSRG